MKREGNHEAFDSKKIVKVARNCDVTSLKREVTKMAVEKKSGNPGSLSSLGQTKCKEPASSNQHSASSSSRLEKKEVLSKLKQLAADCHKLSSSTSLNHLKQELAERHRQRLKAEAQTKKPSRRDLKKPAAKKRRTKRKRRRRTMTVAERTQRAERFTRPIPVSLELENVLLQTSVGRTAADLRPPPSTSTTTHHHHLCVSRPDVTKGLWEYVRERNLQLPSDRRVFLCDERLRRLFGVSQLHMLEIQSKLTPHLLYHSSEPSPSSPSSSLFAPASDSRGAHQNPSSSSDSDDSTASDSSGDQTTSSSSDSSDFELDLPLTSNLPSSANGDSRRPIGSSSAGQTDSSSSSSFSSASFSLFEEVPSAAPGTPPATSLNPISSSQMASTSATPSSPSDSTAIASSATQSTSSSASEAVRPPSASGLSLSDIFRFLKKNPKKEEEKEDTPPVGRPCPLVRSYRMDTDESSFGASSSTEEMPSTSPPVTSLSAAAERPRWGSREQEDDEEEEKRSSSPPPTRVSASRRRVPEAMPSNANDARQVTALPNGIPSVGSSAHHATSPAATNRNPRLSSSSSLPSSSSTFSSSTFSSSTFSSSTFSSSRRPPTFSASTFSSSSSSSVGLSSSARRPPLAPLSPSEDSSSWFSSAHASSVEARSSAGRSAAPIVSSTRLSSTSFVSDSPSVHLNQRGRSDSTWTDENVAEEADGASSANDGGLDLLLTDISPTGCHARFSVGASLEVVEAFVDGSLTFRVRCQKQVSDLVCGRSNATSVTEAKLEPTRLREAARKEQHSSQTAPNCPSESNRSQPTGCDVSVSTKPEPHLSQNHPGVVKTEEVSPQTFSSTPPRPDPPPHYEYMNLSVSRLAVPFASSSSSSSSAAFQGAEFTLKGSCRLSNLEASEKYRLTLQAIKAQNETGDRECAEMSSVELMQRAELSRWTVAEVAAFMHSLQLPEAAKICEELNVAGNALVTMDEADLVSMEVLCPVTRCRALYFLNRLK